MGRILRLESLRTTFIRRTSGHFCSLLDPGSRRVDPVTEGKLSVSKYDLVKMVWSFFKNGLQVSSNTEHCRPHLRPSVNPVDEALKPLNLAVLRLTGLTGLQSLLSWPNPPQSAESLLWCRSLQDHAANRVALEDAVPHADDVLPALMLVA